MRLRHRHAERKQSFLGLLACQTRVRTEWRQRRDMRVHPTLFKSAERAREREREREGATFLSSELFALLINGWEESKRLTYWVWSVWREAEDRGDDLRSLPSSDGNHYPRHPDRPSATKRIRNDEAPSLSSREKDFTVVDDGGGGYSSSSASSCSRNFYLLSFSINLFEWGK